MCFIRQVITVSQGCGPEGRCSSGVLNCPSGDGVRPPGVLNKFISDNQKSILFTSYHVALNDIDPVDEIKQWMIVQVHLMVFHFLY
jgi:hypothetical protein